MLFVSLYLLSCEFDIPTLRAHPPVLGALGVTVIPVNLHHPAAFTDHNAPPFTAAQDIQWWYAQA